jgi:hypothetical protein
MSGKRGHSIELFQVDRLYRTRKLEYSVDLTIDDGDTVACASVLPTNGWRCRRRARLPTSQ